VGAGLYAVVLLLMLLEQSSFGQQSRHVLPKGSMEQSVFALLSDAGIRIRASSRGYRPEISLPGFEAKVLRPQNIVEMLAAGSRDIGFAGADWVAEVGEDLVELLDTGLEALIAPHEGGGGVGLVLGALAAAAGLAVLGVTAREKAQQALEAVPQVSMPFDGCVLARSLAWNPASRLADDWSRERGPIYPDLTFEKVAAQVGWTRPPRDEAERAVLIDALLEAGHPYGTVAAAFASWTPLLWVSPDGTTAHLYAHDQIPELMDIKDPAAQARLVAERVGCKAMRFHVLPTVANARVAAASGVVRQTMPSTLNITTRLVVMPEYWSLIDKESE
jgi:hypothetical protein